ncbi:hypothetical protein ABFY48_24140 [Lysinibacillus pakistanensis]|uniref:hypothetical protein n=1 Tax=Lysinibacillus pakistanensis TaxID=759811 RepID=UPI003D2A51CD
MNDIVRFKIVSTDTLNDYLTRGWSILQRLENGQYEIGLPVHQAFLNASKFANHFLNAGLLHQLLQSLAKSHNTNLENYDLVQRDFIKNYNKNGSSITHHIDKSDPFNKLINELLFLTPDYQEELFAIPLLSNDKTSDNK